MYKLEFDDGNAKRKLKTIAECDTFAQCTRRMNDMLDKAGYPKERYMRFTTLENGKIWIDFGSWSQFFYVSSDHKITMEEIQNERNNSENEQSDSETE